MSELDRCGMHGPECVDASVHHFLKYHDPKSEYYLGAQCVNCAFGRVDRESPRVAPDWAWRQPSITGGEQ